MRGLRVWPVQKFSNQMEFRNSTEFSVDCKKLLEKKGLVRTDVDREKEHCGSQTAKRRVENITEEVF